jgi:hypothetical protein
MFHMAATGGAVAIAIAVPVAGLGGDDPYIMPLLIKAFFERQDYLLYAALFAEAVRADQSDFHR